MPKFLQRIDTCLRSAHTSFPESRISYGLGPVGRVAGLQAIEWNAFLDGRRPTAMADTGSDLNFMSPECAKKGKFEVDTSEGAQICVQIGDGLEVETIGQVYVHNLTLDWRKPVTKIPVPSTHAEDIPALEDGDECTSYGQIFYVLPGLACDVILGRHVLDEMDAFNHCSKLSRAQPTAKIKSKSYELNIFIFRWKWKAARYLPNPKEVYDNERHAEMYRRSKRKG